MVSLHHGLEWPDIRQYLPYSLQALPRNDQFSPEKALGEVGFLRTGLLYLCHWDERMNRNILTLVRPGELFLPASAPAETYWTARQSSEIIWLRAADVARLYPVLPEKCAASLTQAAAAPLQQRLLLSHRSLRERLSAFFAGEAERQGSRSITLPIPLSDLADLLSADRSAMMKELSRMKAEGLVSGKGVHLALPGQ